MKKYENKQGEKLKMSEEYNTEIKDKIQFTPVLQERIFAINHAFDSTDRYKIRESIRTCIDNISPYLQSSKKTRLNKKIKLMCETTDNEEFYKISHELFQDILSMMKNREMLMREIPVSMG